MSLAWRSRSCSPSSHWRRLRLLGTAHTVTLLYIAAGLAAVMADLSIPLLVQLIRRRFVLSLGATLLIVGTALLMSDRASAFASGLALNSFAFACIEITINLYLLDHRSCGVSSRHASSPVPVL